MLGQVRDLAPVFRFRWVVTPSLAWALSSGYSAASTMQRNCMLASEISQERKEAIASAKAELADEIIFFCEKTTVLAEKVFHPATSVA